VTTDQALLTSLRAQLTEERDRLAAQIRSLGTGGDSGPAFDDNFADSGQVAAEQGEHKLLAGQLQEQIDELDHALAKLDVGEYGTCEVCGQPIAEARLEAMPATRYCIAHAQ
jgi:DnaK suppressor protein